MAMKKKHTTQDAAVLHTSSVCQLMMGVNQSHAEIDDPFIDAMRLSAQSDEKVSKKAELLLSQAAEASIKQYGLANGVRAVCLFEIGKMLERAGSLAVAERHYRQALLVLECAKVSSVEQDLLKALISVQLARLLQKYDYDFSHLSEIGKLAATACKMRRDEAIRELIRDAVYMFDAGGDLVHPYFGEAKAILAWAVKAEVEQEARSAVPVADEVPRVNKAKPRWQFKVSRDGLALEYA